MRANVASLAQPLNRSTEAPTHSWTYRPLESAEVDLQRRGGGPFVQLALHGRSTRSQLENDYKADHS